jgi:hypothetical protein
MTVGKPVFYARVRDTCYQLCLAICTEHTTPITIITRLAAELIPFIALIFDSGEAPENLKQNSFKQLTPVNARQKKIMSVGPPRMASKIPDRFKATEVSAEYRSLEIHIPLARNNKVRRKTLFGAVQKVMDNISLAKGDNR